MYLYPKEAQRVYYPHTHIATQIPSEKQKELKRREIKLDISCHNGRGEGRRWDGVGSGINPLPATCHSCSTYACTT